MPACPSKEPACELCGCRTSAAGCLRSDAQPFALAVHPGLVGRLPVHHEYKTRRASAANARVWKLVSACRALACAGQQAQHSDRAGACRDTAPPRQPCAGCRGACGSSSAQPGPGAWPGCPGSSRLPRLGGRCSGHRGPHWERPAPSLDRRGRSGWPGAAAGPAHDGRCCAGHARAAARCVQPGGVVHGRAV